MSCLDRGNLFIQTCNLIHKLIKTPVVVCEIVVVINQKTSVYVI